MEKTGSIFITIENKGWISLPYTYGLAKIKIKNVDKVKGTIDIELIEKQ